MPFVSVNTRRRTLAMFIFCCIISVFLVCRLVYIQIIKSDYYSQRAYTQQTRSKSVEAKRGTIYDTTGERILAQSISTNIITAVPNNVDKEKREEIATKLAEILEKDKDKILENLNKNAASVTIATQVDQVKAEKILEYINSEKIEGINVDEQMQRIYPYGTMLSHVLGFVGKDSQGLAGIEAYYDSDLAGTPGKIVASFDVGGRATPFTQEQYIAAEDGKAL